MYHSRLVGSVPEEMEMMMYLRPRAQGGSVQARVRVG